MVYFISNIISNEECESLTKQFDIEKKRNSSFDKKTVTNGSYGFEPSNMFNIYMNKLKSKVLDFLPEVSTLENVNTYVREYVNGTNLIKHVDRKDISVTMSICLNSTINKEWPIWVEIDGQERSFNTNVGDAFILTDADKTFHWRDTLICNDNERVLQFFLHWIPVEYNNKQNKTLL
jgi:hypothetical protein